MKLFKSQKGMFIIGLTLVVSAVSFIYISNTSSKMANLASLNARSKVLMDAQMAIDRFAVDLKRAYELATPPPDSVHGTSVARIFSPTTSWTNMSGNSVGFYFQDGSNKVCVSRSDARDSQFFIAGTQVTQICVSVPSDLFVEIKKGEIFIDLLRDGIEEKPTMNASHFFLRSLFQSKEANARNSSIYEPEVPSGQGTINLVNISREANDKFRYRYSNFNCSLPQTEYFCVNINICAKYGGGCAAEELIKQSYIFYAVPARSLTR